MADIGSRRLRNSKIKKETFKSPQEAKDRTGMKPVGLWYAFGLAWFEWCLSEQPDWVTPFWHEILLAKDAEILKIGTSKELRDFSEKYRVHHSMGIRTLDWDGVAKEFMGIEINPYIWKERFALVWYYGWDVASGCVWDGRAIEELRRIEAPPETKRRIRGISRREET
jgi:hypothetical protein